MKSVEITQPKTNSKDQIVAAIVHKHLGENFMPVSARLKGAFSQFEKSTKQVGTVPQFKRDDVLKIVEGASLLRATMRDLSNELEKTVNDETNKILSALRMAELIKEGEISKLGWGTFPEYLGYLLKENQTYNVVRSASFARYDFIPEIMHITTDANNPDGWMAGGMVWEGVRESIPDVIQKLKDYTKTYYRYLVHGKTSPEGEGDMGRYSIDQTVRVLSSINATIEGKGIMVINGWYEHDLCIGREKRATN